MESIMKKLVQSILVVVISVVSFSGQERAKVVKKDQDSTIKIEQVISGHLAELNGKYKMRATETIYKPGGFIGEHHHVGPGIRFVVSGELTYLQPDKTTVYKAGDYFYESGDVTHTAYNKTNAPVMVLNFEILPVDWKGSSAVPPMK
jgi:quercetin dioxygenase-like cupin family protein